MSGRRISRARDLSSGYDDGNAEIVALAAEICGAALSHNLGLCCSAEGVERTDQLDYLTRLGCDAMQGYLWVGFSERQTHLRPGIAWARADVSPRRAQGARRLRQRSCQWRKTSGPAGSVTTSSAELSLGDTG